MRSSSLVRTLLSGAVFYVVMAACAASDRAGGFTADGGGLDALVDGVVDPMSEASAAEPDVAEEPCSVQGSSNTLYAVHAYPGKTVAELSAVRVISRFKEGAPTRPSIGAEAFDHQVAVPYVRPGAVAAYCGTASSPTYQSATFILP